MARLDVKRIVSLAWVAERYGLRNALNAAHSIYRLLRRLAADANLNRMVAQVRALSQI